jgi:hypothetical protein
MADPAFNIDNILIMAYRIPSITAYNRLESTPRTEDFDRSLKAEIRDALWMLTRQWQFGEFQGEDAATAMTSKILGQHSTPDKIHFPGNNIFPYDGMIPLEAAVERERLAPDLFLAVQMGRYFIKLLKGAADFNNVLQLLIETYRLSYQPVKNDHEGIQLLNAVKGKVFDGFAFYIAILGNSLPGGIAGAHATEIETFKAWYQRNYSQPADNITSPWIPSQLEYQFEVTISSDQAAQRRLVADHYHEGHLDWYSFDLDNPVNPSSVATLPVNSTAKEDIQSYIPSPVKFKGMPNPRYWMMEESRTDFGKIDTTPTGLLHLLFAEFGLTCSNDWFILPYQLSTNTLCEVSGIVVKDVFGEWTLIRPAGRGSESQWQRWSMFHHTNINSRSSNDINSFYLVPGMIKSLEGLPLEQVNFLRDEMANMVWAVENIVPSQAGRGVSGDEMALPKEAQPVATTPVPAGDDTDNVDDPNKATIRYVLGTTVPHNWIPFIPVHINDNSAEIRLQRARLPDSKGALGRILKEKLAPYYINEEIVSRSGVQVSRSFELARFLNGANCLWMSRKTTAGKGEWWSNLKFDQIENIQ